MLDRFRKTSKPAKITPATFGYVDPDPPENHPLWLAIAAGIVILLPKIPLGNYLLYPLMILTTWFHEMGHGLTAMLLGFDFTALVIEANGNGYAQYSFDPDTWGISHWLVAAGGPLGPAIAGALMILASGKPEARRLTLIALAAIMMISTAIWVRSLIGWAVLLPTSALIVWIANSANENVSRFALQFLGVHAAISMFGQWNYLFISGAVVDGMHKVSDTGKMAEHTGLPHWVWASTLIAVGTLIIGGALWRVIRQSSKP